MDASQTPASASWAPWTVVYDCQHTGVWVFLNPSGTLRISALGVVGYAAFVFTGMFLWQAFIDGLTGPKNTLQANRAALTKLQFPREVSITLRTPVIYPLPRGSAGTLWDSLRILGRTSGRY